MGNKFGKRMAITVGPRLFHATCRKCGKKQPVNLLDTHEAQCDAPLPLRQRRRRQSKG